MKPLFICLLFTSVAIAGTAPAPMASYSPSLIQDKKGNEWYIEQNGGLQRNGSLPTLIGNAMLLHIGNQQFYCQQPMASPDGHEINMASPQATNGISVSRRVTVMEREGALRYIEQFTNTTNRDLTVSIEIRHSFNNQIKGFISNAGRALKDSLQAEESGIAALPGPNDKAAPALLLTIRSPGASAQPRLSMRNTYQLSVFYTLTIPAGQSTVLIHAIAQAKLNPAAKPEDIANAFRPISMARLTGGLPRSTLKLAANLQSAAQGHGLDDWLPASFWGVSPGNSDVLILDEASRVTGHASASSATLTSSFGKTEIPWSEIAAISGPAFNNTQQSWLWMRDGQRWTGALSTPGLKFTLTAGADLELTRLTRLVLGNPPGAAPNPPLTQSLLETWLGERLAFTPTGNLNVDTPWGPLSVPWTDIVSLASPSPESLGGVLSLKDGTRLRVLPTPGAITINTRNFGPQSFDLSQLRQAITPLASKVIDEEGEPAASFVDLAGSQRLIAHVTTASLHLLTHNGPVTLAPANVRELGQVSDDDATPTRETQHLFKAELWGGGAIVGSLEDTMIAVEGRGFSWEIPVHQFTRLVNPVPVTDSTLLRRISLLIQQLGDPQWKTREAATRDLHEMGILAKTSLHEALKQSADAEVTRRLESLLSDLE